MPLHAADDVPVGIRWEAERAERDALVQFDMVADLASLADHHARAVIDKKMISDRGTGMNVDAGSLMCPFGHHPRNKGDSKSVQFVGQAIDRDRLESRITENDLVQVLAGWIPVIGGLHVGRQHSAHLGDAFQEVDRQRLSLGLVVGI